MNDNEMIVAVVSTFLGCLTAVTVVWTIAQAIRGRRGAAAARDLDVLRRVEARLERLEQGVEAVAVEVERVSEGQRFTARLLAESQSPRVTS